MTRELTHFIGGTHVKGTSDRFGDVFDPNTGLVQARVPLASAAEVTAALDYAEFGVDVYSIREPLGGVAGITPFTFPLMTPLRKMAPAIAAGNAFILKPSERDSSVPLRIVELFLEAVYPKTKTVTQRWPSGLKEGASFVMPLMG